MILSISGRFQFNAFRTFFIIWISNKKAKYFKSHFQEAWLSESEYSKGLQKDNNDNTLPFCTVCLESFSVAAPGKKALVLHASCEFHKSR